MPDMNGLDLVASLRGNNVAAPVILITGYPDVEYRGTGPPQPGSKHVLLKPLLGDSLAKHIKNRHCGGTAPPGEWPP